MRANKKLKSLNVAYCNLTHLNLSENEDLEWLDCRHNNLFELDLYGNPKLKYLDCQENIYLKTILRDYGQPIEQLLSKIKPISYERAEYLEHEEYLHNQTDDDPYGDIRAYNDDFDQEDVDSGLADAFKNNYDAYQSWEN